MGHRRYLPIKNHPIYSNFYDRFRMESVILNASARGSSISHSGDYSNAKFLTSLINELKGNSEGLFYYHDGDSWRTAKIPKLKERLEEIVDEFKKLRQQAVNGGRPPLEKMPPKLDEKRLQTEGALDVAREELEYLSKCLKEIENSEEQISSDAVLKNGCRGVGKLQDGILCMMDGQRISSLFSGKNKGLLIISDTRSPYNGMSSADYYSQVSKLWNLARNKLSNRKEKLIRELHEKGLRSTLDIEWKKARQRLFEKNPDWESLFKINFNNKRIPAWPKGVKNYLEKEGDKNGKNASEERSKRKHKATVSVKG